MECGIHSLLTFRANGQNVKNITIAMQNERKEERAKNTNNFLFLE